MKWIVSFFRHFKFSTHWAYQICLLRASTTGVHWTGHPTSRTQPTRSLQPQHPRQREQGQGRAPSHAQQAKTEARLNPQSSPLLISAGNIHTTHTSRLLYVLSSKQGCWCARGRKQSPPWPPHIYIYIYIYNLFMLNLYIIYILYI